jgi:hypothetical protein
MVKTNAFLKFRSILIARKLSKILADQFLYMDSSMNEQRRREEKNKKQRLTAPPHHTCKREEVCNGCVLFLSTIKVLFLVTNF